MQESERRAVMLERWFELTIADSAPETVRFLKRQKDPFANPVGAALRHGLAAILDGVLDGLPAEELVEPIDGIVRIRAVQELSPAQALGFLLALKPLLTEEPALSQGRRRELEDRIDRILLEAVNLYVACRERVFEIRVTEIRNRSMKVLERLNDWRDRRAGVEGTTSTP